MSWRPRRDNLAAARGALTEEREPVGAPSEDLLRLVRRHAAAQRSLVRTIGSISLAMVGATRAGPDQGTESPVRPTLSGPKPRTGRSYNWISELDEQLAELYRPPAPATDHPTSGPAS